MTTTAVPARSSIDPRLRARRIEVMRSAGQKRLRRVLMAAGVVLVAAGLYGLTRSPLLDVDRISVSGTDRVPPAQVIAQSGVHEGAPMLDIDQGAIRAAVEDLPWVDDVAVERRWPGGITIQVTERAPALAVESAGGWMVADREGRLLAERSDATGLVRLAGTTTSGAVGDRLPGSTHRAAAVAAALDDPLLEMVDGVSATEGGAELLLRDGGVVEIGAAGEADDVVRSVAAVLSAVEPACVAELDVTAPTAPVVTRVDDCGQR